MRTYVASGTLLLLRRTEHGDNAMQLTDNQALHDYLTSLAALLRERGANVMADAVAAASRQASGLSTEFLGESRLALRKLVHSNLVALSDEDRVELGDVLEQLDVVLDGRTR